jgi:hypothetical protein
LEDASADLRRTLFLRLALTAALWAAFVLAAHWLVHRFLFEIGPVPGSGLKVLGLQAFAVTLATLVLLILLRPAHFVGPRAIMATAIWVSLIVFGHYLSHLEATEIRQTLAALHDGLGMGALLASAVMLAILLGLPFVPSVEMGLLMMAVFGREGAVAAWLATVAGMSMAFAAGRYMPVAWLHHWLEKHGLIAPHDDDKRGRFAILMERLHLSEKRRSRLAAFLLRHRYLLLAALVNMPGNSVLGGGGGIALVCGFSRLYRWRWFLLTVALACTPIPLLVFFGLVQIDQWLGAAGGG